MAHIASNFIYQTEMAESRKEPSYYDKQSTYITFGDN